MTIPEIRERLHQLADELVRDVDCSVSWNVATELRRLAEATRRRPTVRRAPDESSCLMEWERAAIRAEIKASPHTHLQEIADRYGVNIGRVSEVLRGKRQ